MYGSRVGMYLTVYRVAGELSWSTPIKDTRALDDDVSPHAIIDEVWRLFQSRNVPKIPGRYVVRWKHYEEGVLIFDLTTEQPTPPPPDFYLTIAE